MIGYLVGYNFMNIFRIWTLSKKRIIRTKNVIFDHSKFYNLIKINLAQILAQSIESVVEMLDLLEMQLTFNQIIKLDKSEKTPLFLDPLFLNPLFFYF